MSPAATRATPKKESISTAKRGPTARQKSVRQNVKSRAILSTDPSSSDEDTDRKKTVTKITSPATKEYPKRQKTERSTLLSPLHLKNSISPRGKSSVLSKKTGGSSEDEDDDDEEDEGDDDDDDDNEGETKVIQ